MLYWTSVRNMSWTNIVLTHAITRIDHADCRPVPISNRSPKYFKPLCCSFATEHVPRTMQKAGYPAGFDIGSLILGPTTHMTNPCEVFDCSRAGASTSKETGDAEKDYWSAWIHSLPKYEDRIHCWTRSNKCCLECFFNKSASIETVLGFKLFLQHIICFDSFCASSIAMAGLWRAWPSTHCTCNRAEEASRSAIPPSLSGKIILVLHNHCIIG